MGEIECVSMLLSLQKPLSTGAGWSGAVSAVLAVSVAHEREHVAVDGHVGYVHGIVFVKLAFAGPSAEKRLLPGRCDESEKLADPLTGKSPMRPVFAVLSMLGIHVYIFVREIRFDSKGSRRMKILHIEDFFHPDTGYQLVVLAKYMARDGHDVTIITSEMDKMPGFLTGFFDINDIVKKDREYEGKYNVKIYRLPIYDYISGRSIYNCRKLWNLIEEIQPDVLYVHGNDTYIAIRVFLRRNKFRCAVVSDSHMVEAASANRFRGLFRYAYRSFITPIIRKYNIPVFRDANIDYILTQFWIPEELAPAVALGTDTMLFHMDEVKRKEFRMAHNISNEAFVVLYSGKLDESKGGLLLAHLTCQNIRTDKELVFIIIGNAVGIYGNAVEKAFLCSRYRVLRFSTQPYSALATFYQAADIAVIAKNCSLSLYDYAATGLPVVAEDNETNVRRIGSLGEGKTFRSGSVNDFADAVALYANMTNEVIREKQHAVMVKAVDLYAYDKQYKKYMSVIENAFRHQKREYTR